MPNKPRQIQQLLEGNRQLQPLYRRVRQQQRLLASIRRKLPPQLARHCCDIAFNGQALQLFTDTPVWASKLRFHTPTLLSELRTELPGISAISVHCRGPQKAPPKPPRQDKARRSNCGAQQVLQSAQGIDHPALKAALKRLADSLKEP